MLDAHPRRPGVAAARLATVLAFLSFGACQRVPYDDDDSAGNQGDSDSDGGDSEGLSDSDPTTGVSEPPPDLTPVFDCEPSGTPACPEGQKCTAVSEGGLQNHFKCVPDDGALLPLEVCTPAPESGQDACGAGTVCLSLTDGDPTSGLCFPICRNDIDCEPGLCTTSPFSGTTYCADSCDPIVAICPPGLGCRQGKDRFICEMMLEVDMGTEGANCSEFTGRGCAATYVCMPGALVPNCGSSNCCTSTCDTKEGDAQCASPSLCEPLFPAPAPGFESSGACFVPA
ncbi:hypothetical protein [Nannocystis bainbridge]|uniref:Uncharacterized protein n=1 Tax=Nannocystis bainbridge TaxID=2995303 RepID=A0ABT5E0N5_9BACT|nr:hypothetical protein [Nannocystis bainbridge]MDC0719361.1 hypothetical protein [Nannocystis bainbridge]